MIAATAAPVPVATPEPEPSPARTLPANHRVVEFERNADAANVRSIAADPPTESVPARWLNLRVVVQRLVASMVEGWSVAFLGEQPPGDQLGRSEILDREPHRLEGGDRVRVADVGPLAPDGAKLDELLLRQ